ncbi:diguanylate cyclase [Azospirillum palustre]|uniref:diguanylate cyclase n=1 Tax=Azospirillum palustre TaxID=2044885 RepID=A0A2B8BBY9_9PROT|nr:diguanylate cyclase [Azospirillum palustre]PGH55435.1 diguanylate cyclase [Azospirillum palustre]
MADSMSGRAARRLLQCLAVLAVPVHLLIAAAAYGADSASGGVTYCADPDWPPYETITADGRHQGIAADLLALVSERSGLALSPLPTRDWEDSLAAVRDGRCRFLSFLNRTPKREEWLAFTEPLFVDPNVLVTRESHDFIADLAGLGGETMVLPKGTSVEERVRRDFPELRIVMVDSEAEAFAMVSHGKADMTLRSLTVAVFTIKTAGWFNLKVAGHLPGYENLLRIGVRRDEPELLAALDRGVRTISAAERTTIANRHVAIQVQSPLDPWTLAKLLAIPAAVILTSLFWIVKLMRVNERLRVQSRTDVLTGLANRSHLNDVCRAEMERAARYGRPLSIILVDLDHFKQVNDRYGHVFGDRVLIEFAALARQALRGTDTVGRWGGEEFLILCPEANPEAAFALAERLRRTIRGYDFSNGHRQTGSFGVAGVRDGDSIDRLLIRADNALYRAKDEGRDRVVLDSDDSDDSDGVEGGGRPGRAFSRTACPAG